jgi:hypothetical protein
MVPIFILQVCCVIGHFAPEYTAGEEIVDSALQRISDQAMTSKRNQDISSMPGPSVAR